MIDLESPMPRDRPLKTWREVVRENMKETGVTQEDDKHG